MARLVHKTLGTLVYSENIDFEGYIYTVISDPVINPDDTTATVKIGYPRKSTVTTTDDTPVKEITDNAMRLIHVYKF